MNETGRQQIFMDFLIEVEFTKDEPFEEMHNGKHYPITIKDVKLRGSSIHNLLHIGHIMTLQRRAYYAELDALDDKQDKSIYCENCEVNFHATK